MWSQQGAELRRSRSVLQAALDTAASHGWLPHRSAGCRFVQPIAFLRLLAAEMKQALRERFEKLIDSLDWRHRGGRIEHLARANVAVLVPQFNTILNSFNFIMTYLS